MNFSVVMATYNGQQYIKEQIDTVLINLKNEDELIISDDGSTDNTVEIIKKLQKQDNRVRLIKGPGKGPKQNFENGIKKTINDIIVLTDQDDIWKKNKIEEIKKVFELDSEILVITHNAELIDENGKTLKEHLFSMRNSKSGFLKNIYKNAYYGCCMAFRKELKKHIFPFPKLIYMHDQWIGLIGEFKGKSEFIEEDLIFYRRHHNNVTKGENSLFIKVYRRLMISAFFLIRILRLSIKKN